MSESPATVVPETQRRGVRRVVRGLGENLDAYGGSALGALILICVAFSLLAPQFLTGGNILNIGRQAAVLMIVAFGMTVVILSANIDLSVGSNVALCAVVAAGLSAQSHWNGFAAVLAVLVLGAIVGAVNGALVAWLGVNSFIVTLGMLTILRGLALVYTGGYPIAGLSNSVRFLGFGNVGFLPASILVAFIVLISIALLLGKTVFGRNVYAVGGNEVAANVAGVHVSRTKFLVFVVSGLMCGLAAVVLVGRLGAGLPTSATGLELDAIAAVIIGGASLFGGRGTVIGTLFGAIILSVLQNGLNLLGVNSFVIQILSGVIIILAVLIDRLRTRTSS